MAPEQVHLEATLDAKEIIVMPGIPGPRSHTRKTISRGRDYYDRCTAPPSHLPQQKQYPEHRPDMISSFPNTLMPTDGPSQTQARIHAISDHESKSANKAVQLIAGLSVVRSISTVVRRSGTGDAGRRASRVPSLPTFAMNHFRQPAIPDGRRWATKNRLSPCYA
jgi:hypothetical protein